MRRLAQADASSADASLHHRAGPAVCRAGRGPQRVRCEGGVLEMTDLALILGGIALLAIVIYTAMRPL